MSALSFIEIGCNNSFSFQTATYDRIFFCNPNLAFNLISIYNGLKSSQTINYNGNNMVFNNKTFFEVYDTNMKQSLVDNYIRYSMLTGISINYELIADFLASVSLNTFEQSIIYSFITDTSLFNNLSFIPTSLKSPSVNRVMPVLSKYSTTYLDIKLNSTWMSNEWTTFNAIMRSIGVLDIKKYLLSKNRVFLFIIKF
jgi:hypothetical protein